MARSREKAALATAEAVGEQEGDGTKVELSLPLDAGCRKPNKGLSPSLGKAFPPGRCLPLDA